MTEKKTLPDWVIETSWEVCNKIGGIYTVLSSRARTMSEALGGHVLFIGPDIDKEAQAVFFEEDGTLLSGWHKQAEDEGLRIRVGRWLVPGNPMTVLVNFSDYYAQKNDIYGKMWEWYGVDSLHAYGDYDEASMFSWAVSKVAESFYRHVIKNSERVVFHANEWTTSFALLALKHDCPQIATVFTTHATCVGRSIAGNGKPLYDYLSGYFGDQMACELNMQSKHSAEKAAAREADCFTTVSDITAKECEQLLERKPDVVLPNGFERDLVPSKTICDNNRKETRKRIFDICGALSGKIVEDDALIVSTSGRYEFRNKGIDVFLSAMAELKSMDELKNDVIALIEVPAWVNSPRVLTLDKSLLSEKEWPFITHWLNNMDSDQMVCTIKRLGLDDVRGSKVEVLLLPTYLNGEDGVLNVKYYDALSASDLSIYASYYEPWGYTPLESIAFGVPTIVTDKSGFGVWANKELGDTSNLDNGVEVVKRTDFNASDVARNIALAVCRFSQMTYGKKRISSANAQKLSRKAMWDKFFKYYLTAYQKALNNNDNKLKTSK